MLDRPVSEGHGEVGQPRWTQKKWRESNEVTFDLHADNARYFIRDFVVEFHFPLIHSIRFKSWTDRLRIVR